jgi:hypothetical protein
VAERWQIFFNLTPTFKADQIINTVTGKLFLAYQAGFGINKIQENADYTMQILKHIHIITIKTEFVKRIDSFASAA